MKIVSDIVFTKNYKKQNTFFQSEAEIASLHNFVSVSYTAVRQIWSQFRPWFN